MARVPPNLLLVGRQVVGCLGKLHQRCKSKLLLEEVLDQVYLEDSSLNKHNSNQLVEVCLETRQQPLQVDYLVVRKLQLNPLRVSLALKHKLHNPLLAVHLDNLKPKRKELGFLEPKHNNSNLKHKINHLVNL